MDAQVIKNMLDEGKSMRHVARRFSTCPGKIRQILLKAELLPMIAFMDCRKCGKTFKPSLTKVAYLQRLCPDCESKNLHKYSIKKRGCSEEEYEDLLDEQNGKCAICGKDYGHSSQYGRKARLAVDHGHESKSVRGLLCKNCNNGLGLFCDDISLLQKAIEYLQTNT